MMTTPTIGTKNVRFLRRLLEEYRSMSFPVDVVVYSDVPQDLGGDVEVKVGLPADGAHYLPFEHRKLFAERADDYDVFIYTEDDTFVMQRQIEAFWKVAPLLGPDEVPGFLRYEVDPQGHKFITTIHGFFSWKMDSVKTVDGHVFAEFENKHSALFMLTREHLRTAIGSGKYLTRPPLSRYYGEIESVTSDLYERCGLRKLVCLSSVDDFMVHHLPNKYIGRLGLPREALDAQVRALVEIRDGKRPKQKLFRTRTNLPFDYWDKRYYGRCPFDLVGVLGGGSRRVLSVGCGSGEAEAPLVAAGHRVTGIPLDSVIAVTAEEKGVRTVGADFGAAFADLDGAQFDDVLFLDVLEFLPEPVQMLRRVTGLLGPSGRVVIVVPNFRARDWWKHKVQRLGDFQRPSVTGRFEDDGLHLTTRQMVRRWVREAGLKVKRVAYQVPRKRKRLHWSTAGVLRELLAERLLIVAARA